MAKWLAKAVVQKAISILPFKEKVNHLFQKHVTKGVILSDEHFGNKLMHASDHIKYYRQYKGDLSGIRVLELGSGWYPVVPIALYLHDVASVDSLDIQSWMSLDTIITTILKFEEWEKQSKLQQFLPDMNVARWKELLSLAHAENKPNKEELLNFIDLNLHLRDARNTGFTKGSFDFICSNNTFEHIYDHVLLNILREFKFVIKEGGFMSHFIDLSDHFAHFDKSINIYNFLKFSSKQWKYIDNSIQPQNRLRWKDYVEMYNRLHIPITAEITRPGDVDALRAIKPHKSYKDYSEEELAISHGYLLSVI